MLRELQPQDMPDVLQIWLEGNMNAHAFVPAAYWEEQLAFVQEALPQANVMLYEQEGVEGFIGLQPGGHIAGLFVRAQSRRRGIGRELLGWAKDTYRELTLEVYQKNESAIRFYQANGFAFVAEQQDEQTGQTEWLMRWLGRAAGR